MKALMQRFDNLLNTGGEKIVSTFLATTIFNIVYNAILKTFMTMGIKAGPIYRIYTERGDEQQIRNVERRHFSASKEAWTAQNEAATKDLYEEKERLL